MRTTAAVTTVVTLADAERAAARRRLPDALLREGAQRLARGGAVASELVEEPLRGEEARRRAVAERRGEAAPRPLCGRLADAGADGVARDVARKLEQLAVVLDRDADEPALEDVADVAILPVEPLRVAAVDALHR